MNNLQQEFLERDTVSESGKRFYRGVISASENRKGVLDVDTVKGCSFGLHRHPNGGCYGECYALKIARQYGVEFSRSVSRLPTPKAFRAVFFSVQQFKASWYRIGTAGDPSCDWNNTISVIERLAPTGKTAIVITKHWISISEKHIAALKRFGVIVNTSCSGLDSDLETKYRISQMDRLRDGGVKSICRVITCQFGNSDWAKKCKARQDLLLKIIPIIDNPLRASKSNPRVLSGEIILTKVPSAIGGGKNVSLHRDGIYLGECSKCPDQCGVNL